MTLFRNHPFLRASFRSCWLTIASIRRHMLWVYPASLGGGRNDLSALRPTVRKQHGPGSARIHTQSGRPGRQDGVSTRPTTRRSARAFAMLTSVSLVVGLMTATLASGATPTFRAVGSANQVYVTGLAPSAQMSLVTPAGQTLKTQSANSLGGLLFRDVPPAAGYRVRRASNGQQSGALTVHSERRRPGIRGSTTNRFPTTDTRTSPPVTGRSSPSTCTRRQARRASPASRRARPFPVVPRSLRRTRR